MQRLGAQSSRGGRGRLVHAAGRHQPLVFGLPGLGAYVIEAITKQDFAVVRTMVFVGSLLYIATNAFIDVAYTWVDPRVRLN